MPIKRSTQEFLNGIAQGHGAVLTASVCSAPSSEDDSHARAERIGKLAERIQVGCNGFVMLGVEDISKVIPICKSSAYKLMKAVGTKKCGRMLISVITLAEYLVDDSNCQF